jgi:hypothetical protein
MVELKLELGFVDRNAIDVRSDLGDGGHDPLLMGRWISGLRIMRPDGAVYVEGHPPVATRISAFLLRRTSILYQVEKLDTTHPPETQRPSEPPFHPEKGGCLRGVYSLCGF